jgi:hypothetical protein
MWEVQLFSLLKNGKRLFQNGFLAKHICNTWGISKFKRPQLRISEEKTNLTFVKALVIERRFL